MAKTSVREHTPVLPSGWKIWRFRLLALFGGPVIFFGLLEIALRLWGFGYPTAFLLRSSNQGRETWVQNNQFGWRFFGPRMARLPHPISIPREKAPGTVRIFVLGESAALGDPQPCFGLPRVLGAMLELRHPGVKFEVVNAAMTAINSHTLVPIARDCAQAGGDVWVVYMGNNEVVGPFGAGSVFGLRSPPLADVRANLAFRATRTGQLLDSFVGPSRNVGRDSREWGGMQMFLKQTVRADDPAMGRVYLNFQRNLEDIIRAGRESGAGVVVSTVAVNLRDCAPFASMHRPDLKEAQLTEWNSWFQRALQAREMGNWGRASDLFRSAAQIDDTFAELRFFQAECALSLGKFDEARAQFIAARDLDALRFRCDSRLNDLIRQTSASQRESGVLLADSESAFAAASADRLPGAEAFYEHVHLTFEGNYLLARTIAEQVEKLLPKNVPPSTRPWPGVSDCARRLGRTNRELQLAVSEILSRLSDAPFTAQVNHADLQRRWTEVARGLPPADAPVAVRESRAACEAASAQAPDDALLYHQLAELRLAEGDVPGAVAAARRSLDLLPSNGDCWLQLGMGLVQEKKLTEAAEAFKHVYALDPQAVWGLNNLAICYEKMGRQNDAIQEFRRALTIKPHFGTAWLGLSQLYDKMGRTAEATECFNQALTNRLRTADYCANLARMCVSRQYSEAALTNFNDALQLKPSDPGLLMESGRLLAGMGRHAEAAERYREAVRFAPGQAQAHMALGIEMGRLGKHSEAESEFREAVRLASDLTEARLDLGIALVKQDKRDEALKCFEQVLQRSPSNALALRYVQQLKNQGSAN